MPQRKIRYYSQRIPISRSYPLLHQKRIALQGRYGGKQTDYKTIKLIYGVLSEGTSREQFPENRSTEGDRYMIQTRYENSININSGDRLVYLRDQVNPEVYRVSSSFDEYGRGEYAKLKVLSGAFTKRATLSTGQEFIFKGFGDVPSSLSELYTNYNFDSFIDIKNVNFIPQQAGIDPVFVFMQGTFDNAALKVTLGSQTVNLIKDQTIEFANVYKPETPLLSSEDSVYRITT